MTDTGRRLGDHTEPTIDQKGLGDQIGHAADEFIRVIHTHAPDGEIKGRAIEYAMIARMLARHALFNKTFLPAALDPEQYTEEQLRHASAPVK